MKSFVVGFWSNVFQGLKIISAFRLLRKIFPQKSTDHGFVEVYVIVNLIFSFIYFRIITVPEIILYDILILVYPIIRLFEIIIVQINVLLFDEYRLRKLKRNYELGGYERLVILLLSNFLEIILWFAFFYRNYNSVFENTRIPLDSFTESLYFSILTMLTLGYGNITPKEQLGLFIIITQTLIGIFLVILMLSRFISLLPKPSTIDKSENNN